MKEHRDWLENRNLTVTRYEYEIPKTKVRPILNRTPLGHYVSVHEASPVCSSDFTAAQGCSDPYVGGHSTRHHLIGSMRQRCEACIQAHGGATQDTEKHF